MDLFDKIERTRHLGELFLLWLWYKSATNDTVFYLSDESVLALAIGDQIVFEARLAQTEKTVLSGGAPAESREAFEALKQGKAVSAAKIAMTRDEKAWQFTLQSATLSISGLKIPALMTKADDEKIFERQALIEEADSLVRGLYESFLSMRLSDEWEREAKNIPRWIDDNAQD